MSETFSSLRGGHRPDAPSLPRNTLSDKEVGPAGRDVVSPLRGVTASLMPGTDRVLARMDASPNEACRNLELLRDLNARIAEACDQNDLTLASRLNLRARRLALEVFSIPSTAEGTTA